MGSESTHKSPADRRDFLVRDAESFGNVFNFDGKVFLHNAGFSLTDNFQIVDFSLYKANISLLTDFLGFGSIIHRKVLRPWFIHHKLAEGPFLVSHIPYVQPFGRKHGYKIFLTVLCIFFDLNTKQFVFCRKAVKPMEHLCWIIGIHF